MQTLIQDLRYGARMLMKQPGFTLIAVLTLALGIGANTAIFTVVNAVLLRPLPYPEPDRLVVAMLSNPSASQQRQSTMGMADFLAVRERNQSFENVTAFSFATFTLTGGDRPERISGAQVSAGFFATLRVAPAQGRAYQIADERPENPRTVVVSHHFWQRRLAADPQVIGRTISLNSTPYTVIGVMPESFYLPVDTENPIRPLDACTYEICSLILLADFANPDFMTLLLVYGSLLFSTYPCTLILRATCGTDGGNPRPSPTTGHS